MQNKTLIKISDAMYDTRKKFINDLKNLGMKKFIPKLDQIIIDACLLWDEPENNKINYHPATKAVGLNVDDAHLKILDDAKSDGVSKGKHYMNGIIIVNRMTIESIQKLIETNSKKGVEKTVVNVKTTPNKKKCVTTKKIKKVNRLVKNGYSIVCYNKGYFILLLDEQ
jgi:vacuolar-type H+-ATPase subunit F/Vma7